MKTQVKLINLLAIITLSLGLTHCTKSGHNHSQMNKDSVTNPNKAKKIYRCPMHPQVTSDKPGQTCSICGMNLVEVPNDTPSINPPDKKSPHEGHSHKNGQHGEQPDRPSDERSTIHKKSATAGTATPPIIPQQRAVTKLSLLKQQMIGVKTDSVKKRNLFKSITGPGRVAFDPELYTAQSEYLESLKQWNRVKQSSLKDVRQNAQEMIRSSKIRLKVLGLSNDQIKKLALKGRQSEGLLMAGDGQENWVYMDVFEVDLPYIKKGLSAKISANFLQGEILGGTVVSVDRVINPKTRTAKVRIQLIEANRFIRPESYVNVTIFSPLGEQLAVPLEAIMDSGRQTFVFVKKGEGLFEPRVVKVLMETDKFVVLNNLIQENEEVVIGANFMLDSESRLKSVLKEALQSSHSNH